MSIGFWVYCTKDTYVIAPYYIEWQEEENIKFLDRNNLWHHTVSTHKIIDFLKEWYENVKLDNFRIIKNKNAVKDIIDNL